MSDINTVANTCREIYDWLVACLARELRMAPGDIGESADFAHLGISSPQAVIVSANLADWLERDLPAILPWKFPNLDWLARHLSELPGDHT